jgi:phosphoglycolate phosphatase
MIGDSLHDLHAARAAGMTAIAVLTGLAARDSLAPHADLVLDHIGALPDWLDEQGITKP